MRVARLFAFVAGIAWAASLPAADYVFADSYEDPIVCNGVGCTYCSPVDPVPVCGSNSHCVPTPDAQSLCTYPAGPGTSGAFCSSQADCAGPLACIDDGMTASCRQWCQRPSGSCPAAQTCTALVPPALIGATEWGVCR
jgi:hypothetical protein